METEEFTTSFVKDMESLRKKFTDFFQKKLSSHFKDVEIKDQCIEFIGNDERSKLVINFGELAVCEPYSFELVITPLGMTPYPIGKYFGILNVTDEVFKDIEKILTLCDKFSILPKLISTESDREKYHEFLQKLYPLQQELAKKALY